MADLKNPFGSFSDYQSGRQAVVKPNDFINDAGNELDALSQSAFNGSTAELRDPVKYRQTSIMAIIMLVIFWPAGLCLILRRRRQWLVSNKLALVIMSWVLFSTFMIFFILPTFVYETNNDDEQHVVDQQADKLRQEHDYLINVDQPLTDEQADKLRQEHDYLINVDQPLTDEHLTVDCNLQVIEKNSDYENYDGEYDELQCAPAIITGVYAPTDRTYLTSDSIFGSTKLTDGEDGKFTLRVTPDMTIHSYDWGKSSLNYDDIELAYGSDNSIDADLLLHDLDLPGAIVGRRLTIEFKLTDADKQLLEQYHQRYLQYQQLRSDSEARQYS